MKKLLFQCIGVACIVCLSCIALERICTLRLLDAVERCDHHVVSEMVTRGYPLNGRQHLINLPTVLWFNPTPLIQACRNGDAEMVQILVEAGADVNKTDNFTTETPLTAALNRPNANRFAIGLYLVENGAKINGKLQYETPLVPMIRLADDENEQTKEEWHLLLDYLLENGTNTLFYKGHDSEKQYSVLAEAAWLGNIEMVRCLIEKGEADIDATGFGQRTALFSAVQNENDKLTKYLLEKGADLNICNYEGYTPYEYAVEHGLDSMVELLETYTSY